MRRTATHNHGVPRTVTRLVLALGLTIEVGLAVAMVAAAAGPRTAPQVTVIKETVVKRHGGQTTLPIVLSAAATLIALASGAFVVFQHQTVERARGRGRV